MHVTKHNLTMFQYDYPLQLFTTIQLALVITIAILLKFILKNKNDFIKRLPIYIVAGILVVMEIHKQLRNATGYDYSVLWGICKGRTGIYTGYALPFHFCSFFIVWILLQMVFYKQKKLRSFFENMGFLWSTMITIATFFYPTSIYGGAITELFQSGELSHTVAFHSLVVLYFALSCSLRTYSFTLKKLWHAPLSIIIYAAVAIPAAHLLNENYCNILQTNGILFLDAIFEKGYVIYNGSLVLIGCLSSLLIYSIIYGVEKLRNMTENPEWFIYGYIAVIPMLFILFGISGAFDFEKLKTTYALLMTLVFIICLAPGFTKNFFIEHRKQKVKV